MDRRLLCLRCVHPGFAGEVVVFFARVVILAPFLYVIRLHLQILDSAHRDPEVYDVAARRTSPVTSHVHWYRGRKVEEAFQLRSYVLRCNL